MGLVETEVSRSSGKTKNQPKNQKDINDNDASYYFTKNLEKEVEFKVNGFDELVKVKSATTATDAHPEEKLTKQENIEKSVEKVEEKTFGFDDEEKRLAMTEQQVLQNEKGDLNQKVEPDEKIKVEEKEIKDTQTLPKEEDKLKIGDESSDCLSSSSRRARKRTAQTTPPLVDTTKSPVAKIHKNRNNSCFA